MDGNEDFGRFLELLLADSIAAGWFDPDAAGSSAALTGDVIPSYRITLPPAGEDGGGDPPDGGGADGGSESSPLRQALAAVLADGGTATLGRASSPTVRALLDPTARDEVRRTVSAVVTATDAYRSELDVAVPADAPHDMVLAALLSLLHGPAWGAAQTRLHALLAWYERTIALSVVISVERLGRRDSEPAVFRDLTTAVRLGRNRLTAVVRALVDATVHVPHTHQALVERQLTMLTGRRTDWQRRQLVAQLAGVAPPSPADLEVYQRLRALARRRTDLEAVLSADRAERERLRRQAGSSAETRETRSASRAQLRVLWPRIQEQQQELTTTSREIASLRRALSGATMSRIAAYEDAERRGIRDDEARQDRDALLQRMDQELTSLTSHRLSVADETGRWERYELLLERLLKNSHNLGLELFMDSFLKVSSSAERRRDIGISAHTNGQVQWLSYPGHGDNAVDWNCHAGLPLLLSAPQEFRLPERFRATPDDAVAYRLAGGSAVVEARASDDLQDIFGKIAYGLLGRQGSRETELGALLRAHGDDEIAPAEVLTRSSSGSEVSRLLTGLVARNLTPIDNAAAFDALRAGIVRDLEAGVVRARGLPVGTVLFRRDRLHADSGAFGLGRIVTPHITVGELLTSVRELLSSDSSSGYDTERRRLVNRIWQLLLWLRSAGADDHRRAASVSVCHTYRGNTPDDLTVRVYYSHMYDIAVRAGSQVSAGDRLGLTGSTGNAVNSHVHIEIFLSRGGSQLGACLPHEFFPLTS
ncbi:M23 family metallopeptidase [Micromonospora saelicesensis]|uniref:Peptidase family M23 n=1 Tax=Micromonospora saelicesensis TaxID=285676 RepID=A0A1C4Z6B6_9ACTN|nr:M23 family metallopeptidase [Micromonospora saelicesensis]SCF28131.1 Peptidase family M23 [Micromonospora saelicesensis]